MTNKANKGFVFSAYDKFFRFLLMDNRLFLSIYIGILSFKGYFEKYLESIYSAIRYTSSTEFIIRKTKRFAIPERAVYFLKTKRTAGGTPPPQNIFDRLTPVFT